MFKYINICDVVIISVISRLHRSKYTWQEYLYMYILLGCVFYLLSLQHHLQSSSSCLSSSWQVLHSVCVGREYLHFEAKANLSAIQLSKRLGSFS